MNGNMKDVNCDIWVKHKMGCKCRVFVLFKIKATFQLKIDGYSSKMLASW